jgi:hypothetical protein
VPAGPGPAGTSGPCQKDFPIRISGYGTDDSARTLRLKPGETSVLEVKLTAELRHPVDLSRMDDEFLGITERACNEHPDAREAGRGQSLCLLAALVHRMRRVPDYPRADQLLTKACKGGNVQSCVALFGPDLAALGITLGDLCKSERPDAWLACLREGYPEARFFYSGSVTPTPTRVQEPPPQVARPNEEQKGTVGVVLALDFGSDPLAFAHPWIIRYGVGLDVNLSTNWALRFGFFYWTFGSIRQTDAGGETHSRFLFGGQSIVPFLGNLGLIWRFWAPLYLVAEERQGVFVTPNTAVYFAPRAGLGIDLGPQGPPGHYGLEFGADFQPAPVSFTTLPGSQETITHTPWLVMPYAKVSYTFDSR